MKVRLTVELDVEIDKTEHPNLDEKQVFNGIYMCDDDIVDGFLLSTDIPGYDNTNDFFLRNGKIAKKEITSEITDHVLDDDEGMEMCL